MSSDKHLKVHADPLASKKKRGADVSPNRWLNLFLRYTASVGFDKRLAEADIAGSLAHARMLAKSKIISQKDLADIERE